MRASCAIVLSIILQSTATNGLAARASQTLGRTHAHTHTTATAAAIIIARIPSAQCTPLSVTNANKRAPAAAGCGRAFRPRRCGTQVARGRKLAMYVCVRGVTATAGGA